MSGKTVVVPFPQQVSTVLAGRKVRIRFNRGGEFDFNGLSAVYNLTEAELTTLCAKCGFIIKDAVEAKPETKTPTQRRRRSKKQTEVT